MKKYLVFILVNSFLMLADVVLLICWLITKKEEFMYPLGVCTGLFVSVFLVSLISILIRKKTPCQTHFDERQLKSRGDCYFVSFFFLLFCLLVDGMLRYVLEYDWSSYLVGVFTWGMLAIGVFAIMAIWKNAYTTEGESKIRFAIFLGAIGLLDGIVGVISILQKDFIVDGKLSTSFINFFGGLILLVVAINLFVKYKIDKRKAEEDEELKTEVC